MNTSLILFLEFIKIGFFAIGGGYATLPFLYRLSIIYHWFKPQDLTQMLA
ncbi:chromate transporter, partial [bacterium]|nr:chromate transporter [bacterium]